MSAPEKVGLDERVFHSHLENGPFQSGVDRGRWRLVSVNWPYAIIAVKAAARPNAPGEYAFRFELNNYPNLPPTAQPWDAERNSPLVHASWPGGVGRITPAFNPGWKGGAAYICHVTGSQLKDTMTGRVSTHR